VTKHVAETVQSIRMWSESTSQEDVLLK